MPQGKAAAGASPELAGLAPQLCKEMQAASSLTLLLREIVTLEWH